MWDPDAQSLYWVDILENRIYRHHPADGVTQSWLTPEHVGFVVVRPDGELVAGFKSGLHHVVLDEDANVTSTRIDRVDDNRDDVRFNDATSDEEGTDLGLHARWDSRGATRDLLLLRRRAEPPDR